MIFFHTTHQILLAYLGYFTSHHLYPSWVQSTNIHGLAYGSGLLIGLSHPVVLQHVSQDDSPFKIDLIMSLCLEPWRGCCLPQHKSQCPFCGPQALITLTSFLADSSQLFWSLLLPGCVKYVPMAGSLHFVFLLEPQSSLCGFLSHIRCFLVCGIPLAILYEAVHTPV